MLHNRGYVSGALQRFNSLKCRPSTSSARFYFLNPSPFSLTLKPKTHPFAALYFIKVNFISPSFSTLLLKFGKILNLCYNKEK